MKAETSAIKRPTVTGSVAEELRRRIVSGTYQGGEQMRQEALAAELGVSRIPVREALLQLETEGLVVIHTHKGAVVASLTPQDAVDLFETRLLLEPVMVSKAIVAAKPVDLARLEQSLADYEKALRLDADPETLSRLNWAFHAALCRPAARPRMLTILLSLYRATDRYLRVQINHPEAKAQALRDHHALFDAFRKKKLSVTDKLIKEHITGAYSDVIRELQLQTEHTEMPRQRRKRLGATVTK